MSVIYHILQKSKYYDDHPHFNSSFQVGCRVVIKNKSGCLCFTELLDKWCARNRTTFTTLAFLVLLARAYAYAQPILGGGGRGV